VQQYATGRNLALFAVNPATTNANGVITLGATYDFKSLGVYDYFEWQGTQVDEDIHSGDGLIANYHPLFDDWLLTISELKQGTGNSSLMTIYANYMYLRMAVQAQQLAYGVGSHLPGDLLVIIGKRATIGDGLVEGKNAVQMTIKPCGIAHYWGPGPSPI
jgi:hypothetical protein